MDQLIAKNHCAAIIIAGFMEIVAYSVLFDGRACIMHMNNGK